MEIRRFFTDETSSEIEELLRNGGDHVSYLKQTLEEKGSARSALPLLAEYGISQIKETEENFELADYFFVLSAIKDIPEEARSFFMDIMIYCEDRHIGFKSVVDITEQYKNKIRPLL